MVVSPALPPGSPGNGLCFLGWKRGDWERKKHVSPVGAVQEGAQNAPMPFMRLPWGRAMALPDPRSV